jgi:hypothetical protein
MAPLWLAAASALALSGCTLWVEGKIEDRKDETVDGSPDAAGAATADAAAAPDDGSFVAPPAEDSAVALPGEAGAIHDGATAAVHDAAVTGDAAISNAVVMLKLSLGERFGCGLRTDGTISCWGANDEEQRTLPRDRMYRDIGCGAYHCCGLDTAGALTCVGRNRDGQRVSAQGPFVQVTAGDAHTCALDSAGKASCWGANTNGQVTPPSDRFRMLSAGGAFTCGVRADDGRVLCWGLTGQALTDAVVERRFVSIDAAPGYLCGITDERVVTCWNEASYRVSNLGAARQVSAGANSGCALLMDETVRCWFMGPAVPVFGDKAPHAYVESGGTGRCVVPKSGPVACEPSDGNLIGQSPADFP